MAHVLSTNVAHVQADPGGADRISGIDKRPQPFIDVFAPGPSYGDGSGVRGDTIGDDKHHGGADKAVYAFAREELDYWQARLGRELTNGSFGENLTTSGLDLSGVVLNQRFTFGEVLLEVSVPRQPCRTFGAWLDERGWMKAFTERACPGSYFRVIKPGVIRPGDSIEAHPAPAHGITMQQAFLAKMGDNDLARTIVDAGCAPEKLHNDLKGRLS
ncbi:MAG TPA: MOSC domain-containing protein [Candidatus Corynebacterium gallistercoris]|uniref:MOSC domain-containing protein n=1 Tax=Candidatus Corynebacterium gallistercoris TaxID=2838530 RepID=A0A9D1RZU7_9CORY|nr:MOSC domain-containing protein [Candidatus Corynebacterium gallistercoris]